MTTSSKLILAAALAVGYASATDPANVQDPPGQVGVDQPAGVALPDRNTERDATDTLQGGGRTEVIDGERSRASAPQPEFRASESRGDVQPGTEARASFEAGTRSADAAEEPPAATGEDATGTAESTSLGTDLGYGPEREAPASGR